jgi:hypothetical protein
MDELIADLMKEHKGASVHGHNEFSAKACPSFDVSKEYGAPKKPKSKKKDEKIHSDI